MSDVCTVVSIFPLTLRESRAQIPAEHIIKKGTFENPTLYYVGPGINNIYIGFDRPMIPTPVTAQEIARSLVEDYKRSCLAFRDDDCGPGLFWSNAKLTDIDILGLKNASEFSDEPKPHFHQLGSEDGKFVNPLLRAKKAQEAWFSALVAMADDDYAKTGRPGIISDLQRLAAKSLGLSREWLNNAVIKSVSCPFCGSSIRDNVAVCAVCRNVVNEALYEKLQKKAG